MGLCGAPRILLRQLQLKPVRPRENGAAVARLHIKRDHAHLGAADEAGDEHVRRPREDRRRRIVLLQRPAVHDGHFVGHRQRLELIVRDVDDGGAQILMKALQLGAHLRAQLCVEIAERLVHQENLRIADERAPQRHALLLTARQFARAPLQKMHDVERLGRGLHLARHLLARQDGASRGETQGSCRRSCWGRARSSGTPWRCPGLSDRGR